MKISRKIHVLILVLFVVSCFNPTAFEIENLDVNEIIQLEGTNTTDTILANGSATLDITASLSEESVDGKRAIVFNTTNGSFVGGEGTTITKVATPARNSGRYEAVVTLVSTKSLGTATITATTASGEVKAKNRKTVIFEKAYPQSFTVRVDSASLKPSFQSEIILSAILLRTDGIPTSGHGVTFTAQGEDNRHLGFYVNNDSTSISDGNGIASIRYTLGSDSVGVNEVITVTATSEIIIEGSEIIETPSETTSFVVDN